MGLRFQHAVRAPTSDILVHVRLLDATNALQQDAVGRQGVNLIHAAFHHWQAPRTLIETLLDNIGRERLEIDWIHMRGRAFGAVDNRLLGLHLVRVGLTPALLFDVDGTPLLASESIRRSRVLIERGRFAPAAGTLQREPLSASRRGHSRGLRPAVHAPRPALRASDAGHARRSGDHR